LKRALEEEKNSPRSTESFKSLLNERSVSTKSRIIVALDVPHRKDTLALLKDSLKLIDTISDYVCGVKVNFHLIIPLSLSDISELNDRVHSNGLISIADIKLNDIGNTNLVSTEYLWDSGFDAVIVNPFVGFEGALDCVYEKSHKLGKGVISLAYMSHPGADEGYGLELENGNSLFDLMLERANSWGSDAVILGTTRPEKVKIGRSRLDKSIKIISPGSGAQGGDVTAAIQAGADYLIYGRSIVSDSDPRGAAKLVFETTKIPS
jgi:orotidine-5'-phosphate decarboxylase